MLIDVGAVAAEIEAAAGARERRASLFERVHPAALGTRGSLEEDRRRRDCTRGDRRAVLQSPGVDHAAGGAAGALPGLLEDEHSPELFHAAGDLVDLPAERLLELAVREVGPGVALEYLQYADLTRAQGGGDLVQIGSDGGIAQHGFIRSCRSRFGLFLTLRRSPLHGPLAFRPQRQRRASAAGALRRTARRLHGCRWSTPRTDAPTLLLGACGPPPATPRRGV